MPGAHFVGDEPTADHLAAYAHVEALIPRADGHAGPYPWWHGWAAREAYLAGVAAERDRAARVAEGHPGCACRGWPCDRCADAKEIAAAIRAGAEPAGGPAASGGGGSG